jgi:hypothetical protein
MNTTLESTKQIAMKFQNKLQIEVFETLLSIMRDENTPARDRLKAAELLTRHGAEMLKIAGAK